MSDMGKAIAGMIFIYIIIWATIASIVGFGFGWLVFG